MPAPSPTPHAPGEPPPPLAPRPWWRQLVAPLRVRLLLLVLLAWVPMVGLVVASSLSARAKAMASARQDLLRLVHTLALRQNEYIDATRDMLRKLSRPALIAPGEAERQQEILQDLLNYQRIYADIGVLDPTGRILLSGRAEPLELSLSRQPFFRTMIANEAHWKFADNDYQVDRRTGRALLFMANPLTLHNRQLKAVVYAALKLDWIYQFAPQASLLDGVILTVIDRQGNFLLRYPDPERRWLRESLAQNPELARLLKQAREGSGPALGPDRVTYLHSFTPLSSTGGFADAWAVASVPASEVHAEARLTLLKNLTFLGLIGILTLSVAWFGGDVFVLEPVRTLARATHTIREGNFEVHTHLRHAPGELTALAQDFEAMAQSLAQRTAERERTRAALQQSHERLEQRVAERTRDLQRSNEELEQFAYVASHDLQEPLRMVISYMQLLKQRYGQQLDTNAHEFIGFAADGAQRMQQLINDLLAYSRVGTRQRPLEPTPTEEVLQRVLTNLKVALEESRATVTHDPLPVVLSDPVQLTQMFQNLVGNAIKFHGDQPPAVHVSARPTNPLPHPPIPSPTAWEFCIQDNGIGIAQENFERVFVIFQRLHGRSKYPGTGIGLAICKKIVERHGGRIWLESEPGRGTRFHFTLPGPGDPTPPGPAP
ncbi:MAG: HAMP domain-containing protein [Verrucomicrobia bacterium]|nr:HAMP domain-containing protein [Verrucomicrobiota bacterium]